MRRSRFSPQQPPQRVAQKLKIHHSQWQSWEVGQQMPKAANHDHVPLFDSTHSVRHTWLAHCIFAGCSKKKRKREKKWIRVEYLMWRDQRTNHNRCFLAYSWLHTNSESQTVLAEKWWYVWSQLACMWVQGCYSASEWTMSQLPTLSSTLGPHEGVCIAYCSTTCPPTTALPVPLPTLS